MTTTTTRTKIQVGTKVARIIDGKVWATGYVVKTGLASGDVRVQWDSFGMQGNYRPADLTLVK